MRLASIGPWRTGEESSTKTHPWHLKYMQWLGHTFVSKLSGKHCKNGKPDHLLRRAKEANCSAEAQ